jgi:tRNA pseudouridine55 synthase
VLLLDKPGGISSQTAVTRVKTLFNAAKAGHTGTLDPMATGLLPVALGEATKFSSMLLEAGKTYLATVRLGQTTTTGDLEGEVTGTSPVAVDLAAIEAVLARFRGEIVQTPPMYSALKHAGRPLYEYAREGTEIERAPRPVTIAALTLEGYEASELRIVVACSKGTYIRVLAEDIGRALGCGACLSALRRTRVGRFDVAEAIGLPALAELPENARETRLLPADAMLSGLPMVEMDGAETRRILSGQSVEVERGEPAEGLLRLYGPGRAFLGIGARAEGGRIEPRRLIATRPVNG